MRMITIVNEVTSRLTGHLDVRTFYVEENQDIAYTMMQKGYDCRIWKVIGC